MADDASQAEFWSTRVVRRQYAKFDAECACTKLVHKEYARRYKRLDRVIVLDGSRFRWEGLGNSGVRWMGLLRWGYATGRAPFLRIARDESTMELGDYFSGYGGADWNWRTRGAAVRAAFEGRGVMRPLVIEYSCKRRAPPGCGLARLRFRNGTTLLLPEPAGLLTFFRDPATPPWVKVVLAQQDSIEHSYSKPESLRTTLPLTACPVAGGPAFRTRELSLKCETFAFMQPRPILASALLPVLRRMEPFERIVGVHLRTGYADWTFRNDDSYFSGRSKHLQGPDGHSDADSVPSWTVEEHWRRLDEYFQDCRGGQDGPCFNWHHPHFGRAPRREDGLRCGGSTARRQPPPWQGRDAPRGFLSALLLCAARVGQMVSGPSERNAQAGTTSWGLLVLSDSPALPSLAAHLPALRGRVVSTRGVGQLGHSSFARSCSARDGCSRGRDPGGAWTRSLVDFYVAGVADGFVKGLFTSFLFSTMRRNLLCCQPDAFVQWMAWYNLSRSHRDLPMKDRSFMAALALEHEDPRPPK